MKNLISAALLLAGTTPALADNFGLAVPMISKGTSTYYVESHIEGFGSAPMLVDTGAGYTAIDEATFEVLEQKGHAEYIKKLRGIMADGTKRVVSVYRISGINLGSQCYVSDIEVAVFPRNTRLILGLSALRKVSPFGLELDDSPVLLLSNCQAAPETFDLGNDQHLAQTGS